MTTTPVLEENSLKSHVELIENLSERLAAETTLSSEDWLSTLVANETSVATVSSAFDRLFESESRLERPGVEIRSRSELNGANSAFSRQTNTLYLAREYLNEQLANPQGIAQSLLEEAGNWLESQTHPSAGTENSSFDLNKSSGWLGDDASALQNSDTLQLGCSCSQCCLSASNSLLASESATSPAAMTTGDNQIDALLSNWQWSGNTITYSFFDGGSYYGSQTGVSEVSDAVKNSVRNILENYIEPLINVNFVEVSDAGSNYGQIRYMASNGPGYAYAYYPFSSTNPLAGDVHLNPNYDHSANSNGFQGGIGTHGFMALVHETLHALGLKHPGNYNGGSTGTPPFLPFNEDNTTNTVMTYNFTGNSAATPMPFDLKALQHLYGARTHNAGNTTYSFDSVHGFSDGSDYWGSAATRTKVTIWDSSGVDTLDFSGLAANSSGYHFDLREGGMLTTQDAYNGTSYTARGDSSGTIYYTSTYGTALAYNMTIENAIGSSSNDRIYGNDAANNLRGGAGDDYLQGYGGNDSLYGESGNDTLDGWTGDDYLNGGLGNDYLLGYSGDDSLYGGTGADTLVGEGNDDYLNGGSGDDTLYGGSGDDALYGGSGDDALYGGSGDDTYVVDSTGDTVTEYSNSGIDTVESSISYSLGNHLENLTLTGSAYYGYGNSLDNEMIGNSANNYLWGSSGDDSLYGNDGNDTLSGGLGDDMLNGGSGDDSLYGSSGDDTLDGGSGDDYMSGYWGDDTYVVDSSNDRVYEYANYGTDTVESSLSYSLGSNVENLSLTGNSATMGVGNSLDNVITGNSASNMLFGGDGDDRVEGKAGHDILNGGSGDDMLVGGFGADILIGGIGADTFRFNSVSEGLDTITDFSQSQNDAIAVSASGFGAGLTLGVLGSSQFTIGSAATTIDHRIIYDDSTGGLFFDADGTGAIGQVMFATLSTGLSLVSNDIVVAA